MRGFLPMASINTFAMIATSTLAGFTGGAIQLDLTDNGGASIDLHQDE